MTNGMMWLDSDIKRTVEEKVSQAVAYYSEKYGKVARICYVHREMLNEELMVDGVRVLPMSNMIKHHFLVTAEQPKLV